jgi:hypothetical protein
MNLFDELDKRRSSSKIMSVEDRQVQHAQKMLDWLLVRWDKDTIRSFDLRVFGPSPRDRKSVHSSAELLVKNGWLQPVPQPRHDARVWKVIRRAVVNPTVNIAS